MERLSSSQGAGNAAAGTSLMTGNADIDVCETAMRRGRSRERRGRKEGDMTRWFESIPVQFAVRSTTPYVIKKRNAGIKS